MYILAILLHESSSLRLSANSSLNFMGMKLSMRPSLSMFFAKFKFSEFPRQKFMRYSEGHLPNSCFVSQKMIILLLCIL